MLAIDTSGLFAALDSDDPHHADAVTALRQDPVAPLMPAGILAEVGYMVETRLGVDVLDAVLADLQEGAFVLDCGDADLPRIRELIRRYRDLPLGFADSAVIACAERTGARVLTFDHRHFGVVAREGRVELAP